MLGGRSHCFAYQRLMSGDCCDKFRSKVCKIRIATLVSESIIVVVLLLEVLVGAELAEEGEKYVKSLDPASEIFFIKYDSLGADMVDLESKHII